MPESKHTAGPWIALPHDEGFYVDGGGETICDLYYEIDAEDSISFAPEIKPHKNAAANASLIAAAPELLEALRACADIVAANTYSEESGYAKTLAQARAVIAKAEGKA